MKRLQKILRGKSGYSMVEVIAAFAVLVILLACFAQAAGISIRILRRSDAARQATERLYQGYYAAAPGGSTVAQATLTLASGTHTLSLPAALCASTQDDGTVYYFDAAAGGAG